jgi:hypothetical protein
MIGSKRQVHQWFDPEKCDDYMDWKDAPFKLMTGAAKDRIIMQRNNS